MLLGRPQIIRAVRIRKLLEQADAEPVAGPAYRAKAVTLAGSCDNGPAIISHYDHQQGRRHGSGDGHADFPGHRDDQPAT